MRSHFFFLSWSLALGFSPTLPLSKRTRPLFSSAPSDSGILDPTLASLDDLKSDLVSACTQSTKPSLSEIKSMVQLLETKAEEIGVGQSSAVSGALNGQWECLFAPEDLTRSSPFFWAFRTAFPENADQIFSITDAIPAPIKEVGPAYQSIQIDERSTGTLKSEVTVATLAGAATSIMTTRATVAGPEGVDGLRIRIDSTKPEESTAAKTLLGPLFNTVNDQIPAFPSGQALERVLPGSSTVVMRTTFCDEGVRISRNGADLNDIYVWRRRAFDSSAVL